jgi:hypothetical protein
VATARLPIVLAGVVVGLYTRRGSEVSSHPYVKGGIGGHLGADLPSEATGREELEARLWPRRPGRCAGRQQALSEGVTTRAADLRPTRLKRRPRLSGASGVRRGRPPRKERRRDDGEQRQ